MAARPRADERSVRGRRTSETGYDSVGLALRWVRRREGVDPTVEWCEGDHTATADEP